VGMKLTKDKPFLSKIRNKVIAAFLLAGMAVGLSVVITHFSFKELLGKVDEISQPNPKLMVLNQLFQKITTLDQEQRAQAIKNPKQSFSSLLKDSESLLAIIDSLQAMEWYDSRQIDRLDTMKMVLRQRDRTFLQFLRLRADMVYNKEFSNQLDSLSLLIGASGYDSSVVTNNQRKWTTTYLADTFQTDDRSVFSKLFSKKKPDPSPKIIPRAKIVEETNTRIDTLSVAQKEVAIQEVDRIMRSLNQEQQDRTAKLIERELGFINASNALTAQLIKTLHQVEEEEMAMLRMSNKMAGDVVNESISRMEVVMMIFFLCVAILVFLIMLDISKGAFYRDQLLRAKEEAEELSKVKQRFLANMSHEIRTPLQSIIGYTEQLRQESIPSAEAIKAIGNSSEHLLHIVDEVLDYSRIISGKFTFEHKPFLLKALMEEVVDGLKPPAEKKGLTMLVDIPDQAHRVVIGDAFRLRQVLYNLLGNAVKFTPKGFVKLSVEAEESEEELDCVFEISDSGIGIHPEDLQRIFSQFEQANAGITRQYGGTGLGLTIVKALIDAQGGHMQAHSQQGEGSVFSISMRFKISDQPMPLPAPEKPYLQRGVFHGKALIVDDDKFILQLCSHILSRAGINHITAQEPEKLIADPIDSTITLALLDIRMPHINGVELMRELKKHLPKARFIALTAHVLPDEKQRLLDEGFELVLHKPFKEQSLLEAIGRIQSPPTSELLTPNGQQMDLSSIRQMTMGDESLLRDILAQFVEDTRKDLENLEDGIKWLLSTKVREAAHRLAGRTGQIGAILLSEQFRQLEGAMVEGRSIKELKPTVLELIEQGYSLMESLTTQETLN
jgi:signal transduction histidine kinase/DNA-binding response OmpR family regulator